MANTTNQMQERNAAAIAKFMRERRELVQWLLPLIADAAKLVEPDFAISELVEKTMKDLRAWRDSGSTDDRCYLTLAKNVQLFVGWHNTSSGSAPYFEQGCWRIVLQRFTCGRMPAMKLDVGSTPGASKAVAFIAEQTNLRSAELAIANARNAAQKRSAKYVEENPKIASAFHLKSPFDPMPTNVPEVHEDGSVTILGKRMHMHSWMELAEFKLAQEQEFKRKLDAMFNLK